MKVCVCFYKVWPYYINLFRSYVPFCHRPDPLPRPLFASWPEQLISCPLAYDQPFHYILCMSVNPFGSYSPVCNRPLLLPHPCLVNRHEHKHTPSHTHTHTLNLHAKFQPPREKTVTSPDRAAGCSLKIILQFNESQFPLTQTHL